MRISVEEALRYAGVTRPDPALQAQAEEQARLLESRLRPRSVYRVCSLARTPEGWLLPEAGITLPGKLADRVLRGCEKAVLLLCTLGAGFDALLAAAQARDMASALLLDACGSAYVEAGCDEAQEEIAGRYPDLFLTDRFSPGYGDLPLSLQGDWLRALNGEKRLGVYETDAHILLPAKSVTAAVGLAHQPQPAVVWGCAACALRETCAYRERGLFCGA